MDILIEISEWYQKRSAPNQSHKYSRCPICNHAWWDDKEEHNFGCWVPRLQKAMNKKPNPVKLKTEALHEFLTIHQYESCNYVGCHCELEEARDELAIILNKARK